MRTSSNRPRTHRGFTLIELLVVIAVIAILAALLLPVGRAIMSSGMKKRAQAELNQVAAAIDDYKAKLGYYPPDNSRTVAGINYVNTAANPLYYELVGCIRVTPTTYRPLGGPADGSQDVSTNALGQVVGVTGIANASASSVSDDDNVAAQKFLKEIKPTMYGTILVPTPAPPRPVHRLGINIDGPVLIGNTALSAIQYNSSSPTNNPNTYDLWVDIKLGGKTFRICNWSSKPIKL